MYYKVIKDNKVIDVLDHLTYLKWQPKNKIMLLCGEGNAQAILASNQNTVWHVKGFYDLPVDGYETVELIEISRFEYEKLKALNLNTPEEVIDAFVMYLLEKNII